MFDPEGLADAIEQFDWTGWSGRNRSGEEDRAFLAQPRGKKDAKWLIALARTGVNAASSPNESPQIEHEGGGNILAARRIITVSTTCTSRCG